MDGPEEAGRARAPPRAPQSPQWPAPLPGCRRAHSWGVPPGPGGPLRGLLWFLSSLRPLQTPSMRLIPTHQPLDGTHLVSVPSGPAAVPACLSPHMDSQLTRGPDAVPPTSFLVLTTGVASNLPLSQPFHYYPMQKSHLIISPGPTLGSEPSGRRVCPF